MGMYRVEEMASSGKDGRVSFRTVATDLTKRQAAKIAITSREPKSSILKLGHTYRYQRPTR